MKLHTHFRLIGQPALAAALERCNAEPSPTAKLLVVYDAERPFVERILAAAGYTDLPTQAHLLEWTADDGGLDLAALRHHLGVKKVILFGQSLPALGLHFQVANYFPLEVAGVDFLVAESAAAISRAREAGNNGPAAALWQAIKASFLFAA